MIFGTVMTHVYLVPVFECELLIYMKSADSLKGYLCEEQIWAANEGSLWRLTFSMFF